MKTALIVIAAAVFLAAGKDPTVQVSNSRETSELIIGDTRVQLPKDMRAFQEASGSIRLFSLASGQQCDAKSRLIGVMPTGEPNCAPSK